MGQSVSEKREKSELLKQVREGDTEAMGKLMERHQPWLRAFAVRLEGNDPDGADLLQETYLKVLRFFSRFDGRSTLRTWLYRIMVNTFLDGKRRKHRQGLQGAFLEDCPDPGTTNPLQREIAREECDLVRGALDRLPPKQRAVLTLKVYEHRSYDEIGEILGISRDAVKMNMVYARRAVAKSLGRPLG